MRHHTGRVEVICGSMFCGKTEELIRRVRRAIIARQQVQVFKPAIDDRFSLTHISSHNGQNIEAICLEKPQDLYAHLLPTTTVIAIDEVQFFEADILHIIERLADQGMRVIAAGLDLDFRAEPFGAMPQLMCLAEEVMKLNAICVVCGEPASRTQRLVNGSPARYNDPIILVGASETYEPRCREHHIVVRA